MADAPVATGSAKPAAGATASAHHNHAWVLVSALPVVMWMLAGITLIAWYLAMQFSMNTSEVWYASVAFGKGVNGTSAVTHFSIPQQFLDLLQGTGTQAELMIEGYGFLLEVLNLTFAIGVSYAFQVVQKASGVVTASVAKESQFRHFAFLFVLIGLIGFDVYSSATYGGASTMGSILFAILLQFVAFFFLPLGIIFIRAALLLNK